MLRNVEERYTPYRQSKLLLVELLLSHPIPVLQVIKTAFILPVYYKRGWVYSSFMSFLDFRNKHQVHLIYLCNVDIISNLYILLPSYVWNRVDHLNYLQYDQQFYCFYSSSVPLCTMSYVITKTTYTFSFFRPTFTPQQSRPHT